MDSLKFFSSVVFVVFMTSGLMGCLQTRSNLRGQAVPTASPQQQKAAEEAIQKEDVNKDFRELYGRIENVEKQVADAKSNEPLKALEARVATMETELNLLRTTVSELNAKAKKDAQMMSSDERAGNHPANQPKAHFKSPIADATQHFNNKKWEDAILAYEEYRKQNPKGAEYPEATLKIGMCFQNMSLKEDAKVFYKEVVEKFPKSKEAAVAKSKLKKL